MTEETNSRRKFLAKSAATIAGGAAIAGAPSIARAAKPIVLKVQAAWGGGIFLEFAKDYVKRVNEMSGGSLKIDLLGVGAVVKTAEMQTAVHKGVLDGAHLVTAPHGADRGFQHGARGVDELFARLEQGLLADHALATNFLDLLVGIGNHPVARQQLRGLAPVVLDGYGIGEHVVVLLGIGLILDIAGFDVDLDVVEIRFAHQ